MDKIPFLKPNLVTSQSFAHHLEGIDQRHMYSNFGPLNSLFERRIIDEFFDGTGAAATVANATLGLMLAISAMKRSKGRYALMPSFTFAATPLAAMWCGLEPYFVDIDEDEFCMRGDLLQETVEKLGDDVAVAVPYAAFGVNLDLAIYRALHEQGIPVVIDAAASFGASDSQGQFGKDFPGAVIFSFHATKSFPIGEGGLVYSESPLTIGEVRRASNFGFSEDRTCGALGLNAKLSEYAAAVGLATLDVFPEKIKMRLHIYDLYVERLKDAGLLNVGWRGQKISGTVPFQFMTLLCPEDRSRQNYVDKLAQAEIDSRTYFSPPCHMQAQFSQAKSTPLHTTEQIAKRVISLPLWEGMTESEVARIVDGLAVP